MQLLEVYQGQGWGSACNITQWLTTGLQPQCRTILGTCTRTPQVACYQSLRLFYNDERLILPWRQSSETKKPTIEKILVQEKKKSERNNTQHQEKSNYSHPSWTVLYYVLLKYSSWDLKSLNTSAYTAEPVAEYLFSSLHILFLRLFYFSSIPTFQPSFCT